MIDFDKIANYWDSYSYPWRPNEKVLKNINPYLKGNKALVLGSTKEFRELLFKENFEVYLSDLSDKMIKKNDVGNSKEKIIDNNWFDISGEKFNLILGDLVLLMYNYDDKIKLIKSLKENLSKGGNIILRIVVSKNRELNHINGVLNKQKNYDSLNLFYNYLSFELVNGLDIRGNEIFEILEKYNKNISSDFSENFKNISPYNGMKNYCLNIDEFDNLIEEFNIDIIYRKNMFFVEEYFIKIN